MEQHNPQTARSPEPGLWGSLAEFPLPHVLRRVFLEQLKGTLTLSRTGEVRRLFFEKGEIKTATSSRETQKLGSFLKRRGRITHEDLRSALEENASRASARLGRTLVERGLVPRLILDSEMKRLVEEIVLSAFEWDSGEYRFEPSSGIVDPEVALSLSTAVLIVEGIRRLPEAPAFRARLGDGRRVLRLASDPFSRYQYLPLTPQEAYVLSRIDGRLDLDSLISVAGGSKAAAAKTLYALLSCGLVEWKTDGDDARRESVGTVATLNVEVSNEPSQSTPGHAELVRNTWRRLDWLSHYELLGVARDASAEEIRRAYLDRSRLFHPDLRHRQDLASLEKELTAVFQRLETAHGDLSEPEKRAQYDRELDSENAAVFQDKGQSDPTVRSHLAAKNFERATELIEANDYHPAVELLREAVRFAPDKPEYRFRLGQVELKNVNWVERGLEDLKEAARLAPNRADLLRDAARALALHGRKQDAEIYARKAHEVEPGAESLALLAEIRGTRLTAEAVRGPAQTAEELVPQPRPQSFLSRFLKRKG